MTLPIIRPVYNKLIDDALYGSSVNSVYMINNILINEIIVKAFKKIIFKNLTRERLKV